MSVIIISNDNLRKNADSVMTPDAVRAAFKPCESLGFHGIPEARTAQDAALDAAGVYSLLHHTLNHGFFDYNGQFLGYGVLSTLTQNGLIRSGVEMRADEMTRKWAELTYSGQNEDPLGLGLVSSTELIPELNSEMERFGLRRLFREASAMSGYFGGCLAYIDAGDVADTDLRTPLVLDPSTFRPGSLRGFKLIEPFNVSPGYYSASNPISKSYFKPETWYVLGTEIHASRFLYFTEGQPPTLLLPSYNFFGIPLSQIVLDSVTHFTECREAAARMLTKFSLTVFKTDMQEFLQGGSVSNVIKRVDYFTQMRDNDGVMTIDKDAEDIIKVETPLSGITDIVRQCMEIVAAMMGEPAVKLWGISPGGFNASGESDMQNHYDHVNSQQEKIFRDPLKHALDVLQMNKYGHIDDALTFSFPPLSVDDERAVADIQKIKAETAAVLFDRGVIDGEEIRKSLTEDAKSAFTNIDTDKVVEEPTQAIPSEGFADIPAAPAAAPTAAPTAAPVTNAN